MYKVIIVEDEPEAAENLRDIIRLYCPQFEVISEADNGISALELTRLYNPALLLTDIRMPKMDGLELITRLHTEMPEIKTMIISGYEDFEYARTAMQHGAIEYLSKPLNPSKLKAALERAIPLINGEINQKRLRFIQYLFNKNIPIEEIRRYFNAPAYAAAISRQNGLPSRFSHDFHAVLRYTEEEDIIDIYGRDEMEYIYLSVFDPTLIKKMPLHIQKINEDTPGYTTVVIREEGFMIEEFDSVIKSLYSTLDNSISIGKSRILYVNSNTGNTLKKPASAELQFKQPLSYYLKENRYEPIQKLMLDFLEKCEKEQQSQIFVEDSIRIFLQQLRFSMDVSVQDDGFEFMIDDAFYYASNYDDLKNSLLYILERILPLQGVINKVDTPEFFKLITDYIKSHLTKHLTLQALCVHFGISQTYISRLFRKYTGETYINYLNKNRIEIAKQYLTNKKIPIKDIAPMVGFNDQYYFSRIFHSITGVSPSKWIRK